MAAPLHVLTHTQISSPRGAVPRLSPARSNPGRPVVTLGLIGVNVVVFLIGLVLASRQNIPLSHFLYASNNAILEQTGAVAAPDIVRDEWWRVLTSCFVHVGLLHLGLNMFALYNIGPLLERLLGGGRYLVLYLVAGIGGGCIGVIGQLGCAGASGALCGLLGALGSWTILNREFLPPELVVSWKNYLVRNTVLIVVISLIPGISWSGHLGGAVFGFLAAALLNFQRFGAVWQRTLAVLGLLLLLGSGFAALGYARAADPRWVPSEAFVLYHDYLRPGEEARLNAQRAYDTASGLLARHPTRRRAEEVEQALAALREPRAKLASQRQRLRWTGPWAGLAEQTREARLEELDAWVDLLDSTARCLQEGEKCSPQEENALRAQHQHAVEMDEKVFDLLRRAVTAGRA